MRDKREDNHMDSGHPMRKRRFRFTFYSVAVLIVLLIVALNPGKGEESPLFDKNAPTTLYVKTPVGVKPEFNAADYFPEVELDVEKFSFDWSGCDLDAPGTYLVPVFYDRKQTACVLSLKVLPEEEFVAQPGENAMLPETEEPAAAGDQAAGGDQISGGEPAPGGQAAIGELDGKGDGTEIGNVPEGGSQ